MFAVGVRLLVTPPLLPQSDAAKSFQEANWRTVHTAADLDPDVRRELTSRFGDDGRLADPGEPFDASDVVSGAPRRRFLPAGHDARLWFVAYEVGGRGHHLVLVMFEMGSGWTRPVMPARGSADVHDLAEWRVTLDDLRAALSNGDLAVEASALELY